MRADEIRRSYLDFFKERGHRICPSDSLVPAGDPSLLFTGAGMNQFKELFLGKGRREFTRAASCQKCLRTGDIENVGRTAKHHTFFEMLGNFSFGDYFKREAIVWAWEYVTRTLGLDPARLCVSVYEEDEEAYGFWRRDVGLPPEKIYRFGAKENFWPSNAPAEGPDGPCGPCSEIFFDRGEETGCRRPGCAPDCDCDRFVEIWNLVFTQFDRRSDGSLEPLPQRNIDTGMGLERMASVMQGTSTNYEIDIIFPIIERLCALLRAEYGRDEERDQALRLMADHLRAVTFAVSDGVSPSNEGRGYVIRRLIRRACLRARRLGGEDPLLYRAVGTIVELMKEPYPELVESRSHVESVLKAEEERFGRLLERTIPLVEDKIGELLASGGDPVFPGEEAFRLYDTYGLPLEALEALAGERGVAVDREGFRREMERQREMARSASSIDSDIFAVASHPAADYAGRSEFVGYDSTEVRTTVLALFVPGEEARAVASAGPGEEVEVVLEQCPFYGEGGGQVGDVGEVVWESGRGEVVDTGRAPGVMVPVVRVLEGRLAPGERVRARVDLARRMDTARNHTATHLLHAALRKVLGPHAKQSGSYVSPEGLRFDFSHASALTPDEISRVEDLVNEWILENHPVRVFETTMEEARAAGAVALFDEKYGERVRVIEIEGVSKELCGGTHLSETAQAGLFVIQGESSIAAGTRRIEALTGRGARAFLRRRAQELAKAAAVLGCAPEEVADRAEKVLAQVKGLRRELEAARRAGAGEQAAALASSAERVGPVRLVAAVVEVPGRNELVSMVDELRERIPERGVFVLGGEVEGKGVIVVGVTGDLVAAGASAGRLAKEVCGLAGGRGGGRPEFAQGGVEPSRLADAVGGAKALVAEAAGGWSL